MKQPLLFTVELRNTIERFRLQKDDGWRNCLGDRGLRNSDFSCPTAGEVPNLSMFRGKLSVEGKSYVIPPEDESVNINALLTNLSYCSSVFRRVFPPVPSIEQLRSAIAGGNDNFNNSLVLNVNGKFELRQVPPFDFSANDPSVVVRHETSQAGNDYVGANAAADSRYVNQWYAASLEYWKEHLETHVTQSYCDLPNKQSMSLG